MVANWDRAAVGGSPCQSVSGNTRQCQPPPLPGHATSQHAVAGWREAASAVVGGGCSAHQRRACFAPARGIEGGKERGGGEGKVGRRAY